jgi:AcrR family transcriptional regulator
MTRGRIKGDHEARRVQIAEAACNVFLRRGLARTSLADIAREMGYTTGVLRHYFSDKDELLLYAKNMQFDRTHERAHAAGELHKGLDKLFAIAADFLPSDDEAIDRVRLLTMFNGNAVGDARLTKLQHKRNESHATLLKDVIVVLQKEGVLPRNLDARFEASGILALIDGLGDQQVMRPKPWPRDVLRAILRRHVDSLVQT